jgi:hypothetical protein
MTVAQHAILNSIGKTPIFVAVFIGSSSLLNTERLNSMRAACRGGAQFNACSRRRYRGID